jgi:integrase
VGRTGRHPNNALTAVKVRGLGKPGRYADGNGLYLVVDPSGAKRWLLRTVVHGRRRDIGLGGLSLVALAEAREQAHELRRIARSGGDPVTERRKKRKATPTFAEAAERVHAEHEVSWRNLKHRKQWIATLRQYAFPHIGTRPIDQIDTPEMLNVLAPIWLTKPETARRVRQRIGTVLDWAKAAGFREGENPVQGVTRGLPKQSVRDRHFAAMPYSDVPGFICRLRESDSGEIARLAFEFLILTAARTGEVLGAKWSEVDFAQKVWTVPAERMKAKRPHRVPLADRSVELLTRAKELGGTSDLAFPGQVRGRPMSNMVFTMTLRRMKVAATAHGFRSSFRDWAAECTSFPREVAEMALAHMVENKVEAAYRRGDLLDKRRELLAKWQLFTLSEPED